MPQMSVDQAFAQAMQLHQLGRAQEAETLYRQIIAAAPRHADAHHLLGLLAYQSGNAEAGEKLIRHAIALLPNSAPFHSNLGNMLREMGRVDEAIVECRRAVAINPQFADAQNNLGVALAQAGDIDEATACYEKAIALRPGYAEALNNLANAQKALCLLDESLATFRRAIDLIPGNSPSYHDYLFTLQYHPAYDAPAILAELRRWADRYAPAIPAPTYTNVPAPNRRLRVAYLCANFANHVHAFLHTPLLSSHDHQQFEIFGYSNVARPDEHTARLRGLCDHWRDIAARNDEEVAQLIRADEIDILVDEVMHMPDNRLLAYVHKPAPVQVTWLAYPGTTGVPAIEYRITDPYLDPPGSEPGKYSEESIRLPDTFWCYDALSDEPIGELPATRNGFITFGCLNNFCKVNDGVLSLWSRVMVNLSRSRLILMAPKGRTRERIAALFARGGVSADRIEFVSSQPRKEYLQTYNRIDIALDTLPYNGHTTSLDAFWMGVPVVTLVGKTIVGRATWSELSNLNLTDLAANNEQGFIDMVCRLSDDLPRLADLSATLRERMRNSPLMDGKRFARNFETIYRDLWRRWCERQRGSVRA